MKIKNNNVENVNEETSRPVEPNEVVTQEMFTSSKMLDMIALNNELNSMNKGELRFTVVKKGEYRFDKTDKDGNQQFNNESGEKLEIVSPYVEVTGEGLKGKISTKRLKKEEIELLNVGQSYYGSYLLSTDDNMNFQVEFTSVVPFNQELQARAKAL
jgi:hypothetical protein